MKYLINYLIVQNYFYWNIKLWCEFKDIIITIVIVIVIVTIFIVIIIIVIIIVVVVNVNFLKKAKMKLWNK